MTKLTDIFNFAIKAFLPMRKDGNDAPVIGFAFANNTFPISAGKILDELDTCYNVDIKEGPVLLNVTVRNESTSEEIFRTEVNFDPNELEKFKKRIGKGSGGCFVIGIYNQFQFYIITNKKEGFQPYQVASFSIS